MRKIEEQNIRKLTKTGKQSICVTLPIELVRELGWKEKQKVTVRRIKGGLEIRDWRNAK